ncbi:MAG: AP2 domain-containing protein [Planctomycetota bacterium]|jgi:hypothetical protein
MKKIPLTQGKVALVDDEDYERVSKYKWYTAKVQGFFYAVTNVRVEDGRRRQKKVIMHRFILGFPNSFIDHMNHRSLDNRRRNLRPCTGSQNQQNRLPLAGYSSVHKGVRWQKRAKSWYAQIKHNGKAFHLGCFRSEVRAAKAYDEAAKEKFGEFAWLNFQHRIRRRNIYRWLSATKGRLFSVTFIKRSDGTERTVVARVGVTRGQKHKGMPFNPRERKLVVVFDVCERKYKCIPIEGIEAVCCRGRRYRVD